MVNTTTNILTNDGLSDKIVTEIERVEQQSDQFNGIHRVASLFMHHNRCCNVYLDEMVARLARFKQQLTMVNPTTRIFADVGLPDKTVTEIENLEQQPEQFNDVANHSKYLDEMVAKLATESVTLKTQVKQQHEMILQWEKQLKTLIGIRRMNHPTFFGEGNQIHQTHVEQEPTVEDSHQSQLEIAEIDTLNEQSFRSDSGQMEQLQAIEGVQSHTEDCNEENVNVTLLNDDVSLDVGQLNESEEAAQYSGLRDQIRFGIRKLDGKQITCNPRSTDTSHKTTPNSRKSSKIHTCGECKKQFNWKSKLAIHFRVHSGEKPFQCNECSAAFSQSGNLKSHQLIHTGEKPFRCEECSATFSASRSLKSHQRIHTGEKPYQCKECSTAFRDSSNFKKHQRIHSGEKPFMCDICKKSFRRKNTLTIHMNTHGGKKSHKCNVCQKEFRCQYYLRKHIKIHGKEMTSRL